MKEECCLPYQHTEDATKPSATAATPKCVPWEDSGWRKARHWPLRYTSKEWYQWAQTLAFPHTYKSTKFINLRCLWRRKWQTTLAWRIPGMEEPGGRLSMGLHWNGHDWSDLAAAEMFGFLYLNKKYLFILFLVALGLHCCTQAFSSCSEWGLLFIVVHGLLTVVASLIAEHRL